MIGGGTPQNYVYQEVLLYSHLKYLNKAVSLQIYKKYKWQCAGVELAICTDCVERHWVGQKALLHALCHAVRAKIIFNLAVSTPTAKLPNLISCQSCDYTACTIVHTAPIPKGVCIKFSAFTKMLKIAGTLKRLKYCG